MGRGNRLYQAAVRVGTAIRTRVIPTQEVDNDYGDANTAKYAKHKQRVAISCSFGDQDQHQQSSRRRRMNSFNASTYDATTVGGGISVVATSWMHETEEKAEKSRTAAKRRRDLEAIELDRLASVLPIRLTDIVTNAKTTAKRIASAENESKRLDRGAVLRLTLGFFKTKAFIASLGTSIASYNMFSKENDTEEESVFNKTINVDGDFLRNGMLGWYIENLVQMYHLNLHVNEYRWNIVNQPAKTIIRDEGSLMQSALNAFVLLVDTDGVVSTTSSDIARHLGLREDEIIGQNIEQFIHPEDHPEFRRQLELDAPSIGYHAAKLQPCPPVMKSTQTRNKSDEPINTNRHFYIRMKCTRIKPGTKTKHTGYILTQWTGRVMTKRIQPEINTSTLRSKRMRNKKMKADATGEPLPTHKVVQLVATVQAMQNSPPVLEVRLDSDMFISKHDLAMNFKSCDKRITSLLGYEPEELIGKSAYQFHNPIDADITHLNHRSLIDKGTSVSRYYRFLSKEGSWIWLQTRATLIYSKKGNKNTPDYVSCMNYVVGQEKGDNILKMMQHESCDYSMVRGAIDVTTFNDELWSPQDIVTNKKPMNSIQSSSSSGYSSSSEDDNSPATVSVFDDVSLLLQQQDFPAEINEDDVNSVPSTIPDLCTENISFDDLVSTDDWLDQLSNNSQQLHIGENTEKNSFLNSYLEPNSDIWGSSECQNFPHMEPLMLDGISRSEESLAVKSSIGDDILENWLSTDDPFSSLSTMLSPTDSGIVSPTPSSPEIPHQSDIIMSIPADVFMTTPAIKHHRKPTATEKRALLDSIHDDHRYTSKQKQRKTSRTPSPSPPIRPLPSKSSILRQFLLCREPLNPNKGSDVAVIEDERLSYLHLDSSSSQFSCIFDASIESQDNKSTSGSTLECLLTGQMNQRDVAVHEQRLIETRRRVSTDTTPTSPMSMISTTDSAASTNSYDDPYATAEGLAALSGMDLLGLGANDLTSLWQHSDHNNDISADMSDTLNEVSRQDDLLLQHYFNNIS